MIKSLSILFLTFLVSLGVYSQSIQTFGTIHEERAYDAILTSDYDYLIVGSTGINEDSTESDIYIVRIDTSGTVLWSSVIAVKGLDQATAVVEAPDGSFLITGYTNAFSPNYDILICHISSTGDLISFDADIGSDWDIGRDIVQTVDGGYLIVGETFSVDQGETEGRTIKLNQSFIPSVFHNWGGNGNDGFLGVASIYNGTLAAVGYTELPDGNMDIWVNGLDYEGDSIWSEHYGSHSIDIGYSIIETPYDSAIGICGITRDSGNLEDFYYLHLDRYRDSTWGAIGSYSGIDILTDIELDIYGDFIVTGYSNSSELGTIENDIVIYRYRHDDVAIMGTSYGYTNGLESNEEAYRVLSLDNGEFVLIGFTNGLGQGLNDILLIRTNSSGYITDAPITEVEDSGYQIVTGIKTVSPNTINEVNVYPNPVSNSLHINLKSFQNTNFQLVDMKGNQIQAGSIQSTDQEIDVSQLPSGNYILQLTQNNTYKKAFVIIKE